MAFACERKFTDGAAESCEFKVFFFIPVMFNFGRGVVSSEWVMKLMVVCSVALIAFDKGKSRLHQKPKYKIV